MRLEAIDSFEPSFLKNNMWILREMMIGKRAVNEIARLSIKARFGYIRDRQFSRERYLILL